MGVMRAMTALVPHVSVVFAAPSGLRRASFPRVPAPALVVVRHAARPQRIPARRPPTRGAENPNGREICLTM